MQRALVIYGDRNLGGAIADGLTARELALVRSELRRMQARDGVRRYGDKRRWSEVRAELADKYSTRPVGRVRGAILAAWALLWVGIFAEYARLSAINREA